MARLHELRDLELHVVAQVVEAELVVGAVGNVATVRGLPLGVAYVVLDHADGHPKEPVDPPHPFGVASGKVVVYRDDVDALAAESVEIGRERGDQRFPLTGLHLGDLAVVEDHATDELHVEVTHLKRASASLPYDRERFDQEVIERRPLINLRAKLRRPLA